jgi:hypothetical protein
MKSFTQIALGDETLAAGRIAQCLIDEGLDRHDAILQAIGMVRAENYGLSNGQKHNNTGRFPTGRIGANHN